VPLRYSSGGQGSLKIPGSNPGDPIVPSRWPLFLPGPSNRDRLPIALSMPQRLLSIHPQDNEPHDRDVIGPNEIQVRLEDPRLAVVIYNGESQDSPRSQLATSEVISQLIFQRITTRALNVVSSIGLHFDSEDFIGSDNLYDSETPQGRKCVKPEIFSPYEKWTVADFVTEGLEPTLHKSLTKRSSHELGRPLGRIADEATMSGKSDSLAFG
jgi:hypothetical protein